MSAKKKILFSIILFLITVPASCAIFIVSVFSAKNTASRIYEKKIFQEKIENRKKDLKNIINNWKNNNEKLKILNERIAEDEKVIDLIMILEDLSEKIQINQEISVIKQEENNNIVLLKNNISGNFSNLMKYIKGVENAKYPVEILSCSILKKEDLIKAELLLKIPIKL